MSNMPYSVNLAGGGLDQVYLNSLVPGWNLTVSIEPTYEFLEQAGMATSTRNTAIKRWGNLPEGDEIELAKELFGLENDGKEYISGFQDSAGVLIPGLTECHYDNSYIPNRILRTRDRKYLNWLEENIQLFELGQREDDFKLDTFADCNKYSAKRLADASIMTFNAINHQDKELLGEAFNESRKAYQSIFPESMPHFSRQIASKMEANGYGVKPNGAGGGGYLIIVGKVGGIPIKIR